MFTVPQADCFHYVRRELKNIRFTIILPLLVSIHDHKYSLDMSVLNSTTNAAMLFGKKRFPAEHS